MSIYISDPRPFIPSISPTTSNRFKRQYGNATNAQNTKTQPQDSLSSASKKKKSKKKKLSKTKIAHSKGRNKNKDKVKLNGGCRTRPGH